MIPHAWQCCFVHLRGVVHLFAEEALDLRGLPFADNSASNSSAVAGGRTGLEGRECR
ncbi:hypothetical protein ACFVW2_42495 [Streptomyces sp. NPDC058171]